MRIEDENRGQAMRQQQFMSYANGLPFDSLLLPSRSQDMNDKGKVKLMAM